MNNMRTDEQFTQEVLQRGERYIRRRKKAALAAVTGFALVCVFSAVFMANSGLFGGLQMADDDAGGTANNGAAFNDSAAANGGLDEDEAIVTEIATEIMTSKLPAESPVDDETQYTARVSKTGGEVAMAALVTDEEKIAALQEAVADITGYSENNGTGEQNVPNVQPPSDNVSESYEIELDGHTYTLENGVFTDNTSGTAYTLTSEKAEELVQFLEEYFYFD